MPALRNIRHERFAGNVVSGLSLTAAYIAAGYKKTGASANAARLIRNETVSARVDELQNEAAAKHSQLRQERISSLQQRIDGYNERRQRLLAVIGERAVAGWDAPGASTGLLVRRQRSGGGERNQKVVYEFEVDTGLLRELRELEKQAAVELGQWTRKSHLEMDATINQRSEILAATFTLEELERMLVVAEKTAEQRQQQENQPATAAALPSGEDGGIPVTAEVVEEDRPKVEEPEADIPEWMR